MTTFRISWTQRMLVSSVIALGCWAQPALAQLTVTTTITSINGEDPATENLRVRGPLRVGVRPDGDGGDLPLELPVHTL